MTRTPLTEQQLDEYEALANNATLLGAEIASPGILTVLVAEVRRLRDRVEELETYAHGCDGEGCVIPHSSWCEVAKKTAAENNGCTCPQPWKGHPQPHAGYCWLVSPPRNEIEEMRRALAEQRKEAVS
ncbi:hypothetical protein K4749_01140 [Streptomyces sp. TRM72054]|uniref:hypothetical protein n=1 Tax=Streptomyces sp. TRM72054 TaxID=2870562 RepID=UPI001C8C9FF7|nr:hypothetical protein [Streptomyces sp. TRM72054]MBX9392235.1 hypothetical protein [Streptomyces sp. TRM72054]